MNPIVAIVLATYNRRDLIIKTLQSIQKQSYPNWICYIIDDESTDDTENVVQHFIHADNRFKYCKKDSRYQKGPSGARNQGIDLAKNSSASYIQFVDDDDIIHQDNLKLTVAFLEKHSSYQFCHYQKMAFTTEESIITENYSHLTIEQYLNTTNLAEVVQEKIGMALCTVLWRTNALNNGFIESLTYAEEWELYSRIIANGTSGIIVNETLYFNRKHEVSNTGFYWRGNQKSIDSKMQASLYILQTLSSKNLLTRDTRNYLLNILIRHRGFNYFSKAMSSCNLALSKKLKYFMYYLFFPIVFILFQLKNKYVNHD
jgi:GalNAc5-diNAcBac-PP-undecaprenol beta-1,3-glucosyltransferase